jgi:regulatory protein
MIITEIRACKKNKNRVNVYIEDAFAFACYAETAAQNHLKQDGRITQADMDRIAAEDGNRFALQTALQYVSVKPRTQKEVENRLRGRDVADAQIAFAIEKLREYGYLDDAGYADTFARELAAKYGGRMITQKLMQRGIDGDTAREAAARYEAADTLREQYERLCAKYRDEEPRKRKQKTARALAAKGFGYDAIRSVMDGAYEE